MGSFTSGTRSKGGFRVFLEERRVHQDLVGRYYYVKRATFDRYRNGNGNGTPSCFDLL